MNKFRTQYKKEASTEPVSQELRKKTLTAMATGKLQPKTTYKRYRWGVIAPVVAVLTLTVTVAAAVIVPKFLKPSERGGYEGHIYWLNEGEAVERTISDDLWPSIGTDVNQTKSGNNLSVSIKDIVYDGLMMYINFDIQTKDGAPLQESTENSNSLLYQQQFGEMYIECRGEKSDIYAFRIDNAAEPHKASFEGFLTKPGLSGEEIKLVISDFYDMVEVTGDIGYLYGNLSELYNEMKPAGQNDFTNIGTLFAYADGTKTYMYTLAPGNQKIQFSKQYPEAYIDNIGFHSLDEMENQGLYISIVPGSKGNAINLSNGLAFQNIVTGEIIPSSYRLNHEDVDYSLNEGRIIISLSKWMDRFYEDPASDLTEQDLSNYVLVWSQEPAPYLREKGTWVFDFTVDNIAETKEITAGEKVETADGTIVVDTIKLSPLGLYVEGSIANWSGNQPKVHDVYLIMENGSNLLASRKGGSGTFGEVIELQYMLDKVVDVDKVQAVNLWGALIKVK